MSLRRANTALAGGAVVWSPTPASMAWPQIVGLSYMRFLAHLARVTRTLFVASGVTFIGAAVGMEMICAGYSAAGGRYQPGFMVFVTIEEGLAMTSIAVFLYAVLTYAAESIGGVHLEIRA